MGEMTRRDFLRASKDGVIGAGAGLALGGEALAEEPYSKTLRPNRNYKLAVFNFDFQGPKYSDYENDQSRAIAFELKDNLQKRGVSLIDAGAVIGELELRGIDSERFREYPGIIAHLDPKSNFIRDTDIVTGVYTSLHGPDRIDANYIDLETGEIITTPNARGELIGNRDRMIDDIAIDIAAVYKSIKKHGF